MSDFEDGLDYEYRRDAMLSGKAFGIAESRHRKEKREFEVLVNRLRARRWRVNHPDRARSTNARFYARNADRLRERARERDRKKRAAAGRPTRGTVYVCLECGVDFCRVDNRGQPAKFCCAGHNARHNRAKKRARKVPVE